MKSSLACAVLAACLAHGATAAELERGARGHGMSVFEGETPTRFEVEILGVLHAAGTTGDSYLARLSGANLEHTGVLQGMSGSPVYIDGALVGAVMATWAFAKEPLCTIRPIGEMRSLIEDLERGAHPGYRPGDSKVRAPALDALREDVARAVLLGEADPLSTPQARGFAWSASGFAPEILEAMQTSFGAPVQAVQSSAVEATSSARELAAGDALAVLLVDGAARLSAVGTVTERDGDRVLAFGHPMLGIGPTSLPLARARVLAAMPSNQISFKISEVGELVGTLLIDQRPGLLGILGVEAEMLPMSVSVDGRDYAFQLGRVAALLPDLAGWCARAALLDRAPVGDDSQLQLQARVEFEGHDPLVAASTVGGSFAGSSVGSDVAMLLTLALGQPEWASTLRAVELQVTRETVARRARIERVLVRPERPAAGDELSIRVELREDGAASHWQELSLRVPDGQPAGPLRLHVGDGVSSFRDELLRAPTRWEDPGVDAIRDALARRASASSLVAVLYAPPRSVLVGDRELGPLPESMRALLLEGAGRNPGAEVAASVIARSARATPWLLRGQQVVELSIEGRDDQARKERP